MVTSAVGRARSVDWDGTNRASRYVDGRRPADMCAWTSAARHVRPALKTASPAVSILAASKSVVQYALPVGKCAVLAALTFLAISYAGRHAEMRKADRNVPDCATSATRFAAALAQASAAKHAQLAASLAIQ